MLTNLLVAISAGLILWRLMIMSEALDRLTREVQETNDAVQSAVTLIAGLAQTIRDNIDDSEALNQLADDLDAQQATLAAAVTESTPTPAPTPEA